MAAEPATMPVDGMDSKIHLIRGHRVMLDSDLAAVYGVSTKQLNQQVKRNLERFPLDFAFRLTQAEVKSMRSQFVTASKRNTRFRPWAFTEHGAIMAASVLSSERAVEMSVFVVRAFTRMREMLSNNRELASRLTELENRVAGHGQVLTEMVAAIRQLLEAPAEEKESREIGFHMREQAPPYRTKKIYKKT